MRGVFVTGTDTGAGKTVVAAAICAALRAAGSLVVPFKPVVTGDDELAGLDWPPDHVLLGRAAGVDPDGVAPARFGPPVSPHLAQELAGAPLHPVELADAAREAGARASGAAASAGGFAEGGPVAAPTGFAEGGPVVRPTGFAAAAPVLVVEGVGGLLVPLTHDYSVRDLAVELALPLVVAARPGLGTINHTLLTLEVARAAGLDVAGVVMTPWPGTPSRMERSNRETVARLGDVEVATLPELPRADVGLLAAAGARLPLGSWLGERRAVRAAA